MLTERLPTALDTGRASDKEAARGLEQPQAEPFSDYYAYAPSIVVVPGGLQISPEHDRGTFVVATLGRPGDSPERLTRGALATVQGQDGSLLLEPSPSLLSAFLGRRLEGRWVRTDEPIRQGDPGAFLRELLQRFPHAEMRSANGVDGGWLQIWGVLFPEEVGWRHNGDGWVFVCLFDKTRSSLIRGHNLPRSDGVRQHGRRGGRHGRKRHR